MLTGQAVQALSTHYFDDQNDTNSSSATTVDVVGSNPYVNNAVVYLRAYFATNSGKVEIQGAHFCDGTWDDPNDNTTSSSDIISTYKIIGTSTLTYYGRYIPNSTYASWGNGTSTCGDYIVDVSSIMHYSSNLGLYYVDIQATPTKYGYLNGFKVLEPNTSNNPSRKFIAQLGASNGDTTGKNVTIQEVGTSPTYRNYYVKFGSDCTISSSTQRAMYFYDLDNTDDSSGAQPSWGTPITIKIKQTLNGVDSYVTMDHAVVGGTTYAIHSSTWQPVGGSSTTVAVYFTMVPSAKYQVELNNVYWNNTIQFTTPTDGVYYEQPCTNAGWSITGSTNLDKYTIVPGQTATWNHWLTKQGASSGSTNYQRLRTMTGASTTILPNPAAAWSFASGTITSGAGTTTYKPTASDIGKRVCEQLRWIPNNTVSTYDYTKLECTDVVKMPLVNVFSDDVRVGSGYTLATADTSSGIDTTLLEDDSGRYYGSWGEYGVLAGGNVSGFSSGSGILNYSKYNSSNESSWSDLTFANESNKYGYYTISAAQLGLLPDVKSALSNMKFDKTITASTISSWPAGATSVLVQNPGGTVTITGNITKPSSYTGDGDVPQMIIIADNIVIQNNVTSVSAWLVAQGGSGSVYTCETAESQLTTSTCSSQLVINGPVIANKLYLRRTYGGDLTGSPAAGAAAEQINLPADAYVWSEQQSEKTSELRTVSVQELPPRY